MEWVVTGAVCSLQELRWKAEQEVQHLVTQLEAAHIAVSKAEMEAKLSGGFLCVGSGIRGWYVCMYAYCIYVVVRARMEYGLRTQADSPSLNPCPKGCSLFYFRYSCVCIPVCVCLYVYRYVYV